MKNKHHRPHLFSLLLGICLTLLCVLSAATSAQDLDLSLNELEQQFVMPEQEVDFAQAKLMIDRLIDPAIDAAAVLREIDDLTTTIKKRISSGITKRAEMDVLLDTLYKPGSWNAYRPFAYDLEDPFGRNATNKLLATYLTTRKGNCVSMPILIAILGQRLGLIVTLTTAPSHVLMKFVDDEGIWLNIEATAGGYKADASYARETEISALAMHNEIYLRPLSPREAVGIMASTLMEQYAAQKRSDDLLAVAVAVADMILAVNPKDTVAMIQKGNAYYLQLQDRYVSKYTHASDIPVAEQADFKRLSQENLLWFAKVESLGWKPPAPELNDKYLESIDLEKKRRGSL